MEVSAMIIMTEVELSFPLRGRGGAGGWRRGGQSGSMGANGGGDNDGDDHYDNDGGGNDENCSPIKRKSARGQMTASPAMTPDTKRGEGGEGERLGGTGRKGMGRRGDGGETRDFGTERRYREGFVHYPSTLVYVCVCLCICMYVCGCSLLSHGPPLMAHSTLTYKARD